jgi:hypothetical protein
LLYPTIVIEIKNMINILQSQPATFDEMVKTKPRTKWQDMYGQSNSALVLQKTGEEQILLNLLAILFPDGFSHDDLYLYPSFRFDGKLERVFNLYTSVCRISPEEIQVTLEKGHQEKLLNLN